MKRIKTASGFFREVRPRAGVVTVALMFLLSFVAGAAGLLVAVIYCLPLPVTLLAFAGLSPGMLTVLYAITLTGGGAAMGLTAAAMLEDMREERRLRAARAARHRPQPGPWGTCVIRQDRLRDSILQARELAIIPRRLR